jgi:hypothetical protein
MLNVVAPLDTKALLIALLSVIMLCVIMLRVVMLSVVKLNVVAPLGTKACLQVLDHGSVVKVSETVAYYDKDLSP